jgi:hypothetical protein
MLARVIALLVTVAVIAVVSNWLGLINGISAVTLAGIVSFGTTLCALVISAFYIYTRLE